MTIIKTKVKGTTHTPPDRVVNTDVIVLINREKKKMVCRVSYGVFHKDVTMEIANTQRWFS